MEQWRLWWPSGFSQAAFAIPPDMSVVQGSTDKAMHLFFLTLPQIRL